MTKIKDLYRELKSTEDDFSSTKLYVEMLELIQKDKSELEGLIQEFHEEDNSEDKLTLADILLNFGYQDFIEDIKKILNDKDRLNRYEAAVLLLRCGDPSGSDIIRQEAKDINTPMNQHTIIYDLKNADNDYAKKLYDELHQICLDNFEKSKYK